MSQKFGYTSKFSIISKQMYIQLIIIKHNEKKHLLLLTIQNLNNKNSCKNVNFTDQQEIVYGNSKLLFKMAECVKNLSDSIFQ